MMRKSLFTVGGAVCVLALATGCSSSKPAGSATAGASSGAASSSQVSAASAALVKASDFSTIKLGQTPLAAKPSTSKLIISLSSTGAERQWEGVQAGATAAGWQSKSILIDLTNPSSLLSAMKAALAFKPFAVTFAGAPESLWASELPAYEAAGVYIIPNDVGEITTPSPMIKTPVSTDEDQTAQVQLAANWFISDSNGTGKVLVANYPADPPFALNLKIFKDYVNSHCSGCSVQSVDMPYTAAYTSQTTSTVVSKLQADPSIKYVDTFWGDPFIGFTAALQAANLSGIHLFGNGPSLIDLQQMQNGQLPGAWVSTTQKIFGWMDVDVALRLAEGSSVKLGDGGTPLALLTKANVGTPSSADSQELPADYASEFKTLWHVAG